MAGTKHPAEMRQFVEERAGACCEYCKANVIFSPNPFTIDHIIPKSAEGSDDTENLAYACFGCNRCKHDHTKAFDPFSQREVPLYNPRRDNWNIHFTWSIDAIKVLGLTPNGRATVEKLKLNRSELIRMREELVAVNRHPPLG